MGAEGSAGSEAGFEGVEAHLRAALREAPAEVVCAYLFGSVARGEARAGSDVDVAVLYAKAPEPRLDAGPLDLEGALERAVGRPVQLVVLNTAPADLVHRVLRDGRLLLERDRAARIHFEVAKRNEYFDLEPIRRRYRRMEGPADGGGAGGRAHPSPSSRAARSREGGGPRLLRSALSSWGRASPGPALRAGDPRRLDPR